jgi:hypothetical protein
MTKFRVCTLLIFLCLNTVFAFSQSNNWILKSNKDGVKVYYKKTSDVYEIKLTTSIQVPLSGIVLLFNEVDNYPKWGYKIMSSQVIKKVSDNEVYYHSKIDFPWPMDDRDIVMHTKLEQNPSNKVITSVSNAIPDMLPTEKGFLRIRNSVTKWTLVPSADGWVYVEYYIYSNPGGSLPDWLVNSAIEVGPRETIKSIKNMVKQERYQKAKLTYIKEL